MLFFLSLLLAFAQRLHAFVSSPLTPALKIPSFSCKKNDTNHQQNIQLIDAPELSGLKRDEHGISQESILIRNCVPHANAVLLEKVIDTIILKIRL
jgi:hypothetical protein